jgi:hypothetical protein
MKRLFSLWFLAACGQSFKVEPLKVEPIHMTIDVNLHDSPTDRPSPRPLTH